MPDWHHCRKGLNKLTCESKTCLGQAHLCEVQLAAQAFGTPRDLLDKTSNALQMKPCGFVLCRHPCWTSCGTQRLPQVRQAASHRPSAPTPAWWARVRASRASPSSTLPDTRYDLVHPIHSLSDSAIRAANLGGMLIPVRSSQAANSRGMLIPARSSHAAVLVLIFAKLDCEQHCLQIDKGCISGCWMTSSWQTYASRRCTIRVLTTCACCAGSLVAPSPATVQGLT